MNPLIYILIGAVITMLVLAIWWGWPTKHNDVLDK